MNRKVPQEIVIQTLFGPEVATKKCDTCHEEKYLHEFYCESTSKTKKFAGVHDQVRKQCIVCWSARHGRKYS